MAQDGHDSWSIWLMETVLSSNKKKKKLSKRHFRISRQILWIFSFLVGLWPMIYILRPTSHSESFNNFNITQNSVRVRNEFLYYAI